MNNETEDRFNKIKLGAQNHWDVGSTDVKWLVAEIERLTAELAASKRAAEYLNGVNEANILHLVAERDALRAALERAASICDEEAASHGQMHLSANIAAGNCAAAIRALIGATVQPKEGQVYLPKITPELSEEYGDTDLMLFGAGQWNWSGTAVDFAALLNMHRRSSQTTASPGTREEWLERARMLTTIFRHPFRQSPLGFTSCSECLLVAADAIHTGTPAGADYEIEHSPKRSSQTTEGQPR